MFYTYEKRYASKCNFSALLFATKIMLLYYACQRSFVAFLCLARQIQARKTVLKQKSRSTTIKFWMYYNFNYVHVNFQDMFYTYEKRYVSKCNFLASFCDQNYVVYYYGVRSLAIVAFLRLSKSSQKNCSEISKKAGLLPANFGVIYLQLYSCEFSGYVSHLGKKICIEMYFFRVSFCEQNVLLSCNFTFGTSITNQKIQF